jgi:hypothetical protein
VEETMPVRIKPVHILKPCVIDMVSIKGICKLVDDSFNQARYAAEDGVWEVFDETSEKFLAAISSVNITTGMPDHETLDSILLPYIWEGMTELKAENGCEIKVGFQ